MQLENWQRIRELILDVYQDNGENVLFDTDKALLKSYTYLEKHVAEEVILANTGHCSKSEKINQDIAFLFAKSDYCPFVYSIPIVNIIFIYIKELNFRFTITQEQLEERVAEAREKSSVEQTFDLQRIRQLILDIHSISGIDISFDMDLINVPGYTEDEIREVERMMSTGTENNDKYAELQLNIMTTDGFQKGKPSIHYIEEAKLIFIYYPFTDEHTYMFEEDLKEKVKAQAEAKEYLMWVLDNSLNDAWGNDISDQL